MDFEKIVQVFKKYLFQKKSGTNVKVLLDKYPELLFLKKNYNSNTLILEDIVDCFSNSMLYTKNNNDINYYNHIIHIYINKIDELCDTDTKYILVGRLRDHINK